MHRVVCFVLIWMCVSAFGCRYRDPSVDLLERELRFMEDQVYMMEDELEHTCAELESCRNGNNPCVSGDSPPANVIFDAPEILSEPSSRSKGSSDSTYEVIPSPEAAPQEIPSPRVEFPGATESRSRVPTYETIPENSPDIDSEPMKLVPPTVEMEREPTLAEPEPQAESVPVPQPSAVRDEVQNKTETSDDDSSIPELTEPQVIQPPDVLPDPDDSGPQGAPPKIDPQSSQRNEPSKLKIGLSTYVSPLAKEPPSVLPHSNDIDMSPLDAHVTHVVATGWLNSVSSADDPDNQPDLFVVIEPRNQDGIPILLAGPIAVVVLDGNFAGEQARVGRWDFDPATSRRLMKSTSYGTGIHLDLQWPKEAPVKSDKLQLFVRYTTVEGKNLEYDVPVRQNPPRVSEASLRNARRGSRTLDVDDRGDPEAASSRSEDEASTTGAWRTIRSKNDMSELDDSKRSSDASSIPLQPIPNE